MLIMHSVKDVWRYYTVPLRGGKILYSNLDPSYVWLAISGFEHSNSCFCVTFTSNNSHYLFLLTDFCLFQLIFHNFCQRILVGGVDPVIIFTLVILVNINFLIEGANICPTQVLIFCFPPFFVVEVI